jgi:glutathione S-transferase
MAAVNQHPIILFHYPGSLWAAKITAYLALRGISYHECIQPGVMPRPDLAGLDIHYRRIPVLAIGRDIYFDTVLMLEKLEQLFPGNTLGARDPTSRALEKTLEKWIENAVMPSIIGSLPPAFLNNEQMVKDRRQCWDSEISVEAQEKGRPLSLVNLRTHFNFLESLFSDDRHWVLSTDNPGLADIHSKLAGFLTVMKEQTDHR